MRPSWVSFFVFFILLIGTYYSYKNWLENDSNLIFSENVAYSHTSQVITLSAPSGKRLVPLGAVLGVNDVSEVIYTFNVNVNEDQALEVMADNITFINGNTIYSDVEDLLVIDFDSEMISDKEAIVTVTVSLKMPSSELEQAMIQNSRVSFQLIFHQLSAD